jgi:hypothetical protein
MSVMRFRTGCIVALSVCLLGAPGFAQEGQVSVDAGQPARAPVKAHLKKSAQKKASPQPNSEEAEKAARLAEGRKKFFEQSMGFDNGKSSDSPVSLTGDGNGGLSPTAGFKF